MSRRAFLGQNLAVVLSLVPAISGQTGGLANTFLLDPNRPVAYLHVERIGLGRVQEDGRRHERVWLSFHNNCTLPINVRTFGAPAGDEPESTGVMDQLVDIPSWRMLSVEEDKELGPKQKPSAYSFDVGSRESIGPGEELKFSLPATHLSKRWSIEIPFSFGLPEGHGPRDDRAWGGTIGMYLSFSAYDLSPEMQKTLASTFEPPESH